ncbi:MAG: internal scaffolding protein [Microvirus sp.]|nr:MAG: internal scaffolding protein [Microvirus sp.]
MFVRNPYNYSLSEASFESGLDCSADGPGRTKQSFKEEADINTLIKRFGVGAPLPQSVRPPSFGDFSSAVVDYQSALNLLNKANSSFMNLPAEVRARFSHNPQEFIAFVDDDRNRLEAERLGLVPKPVASVLAVPTPIPEPFDKA